MGYKLLVLDLDDTLLRDDLTISEKNKTAIKAAVEKGVTVVLGSGRAPIAMRKYIQALDLNQYGICYNGTMVVDLENQKTIFQKNIALEDAKYLFEYMKPFDVDVQTYIGNTLYVKEFKETTKRYCEITGMIAEVVELEKDIKQDVVKVLLVGEHDYLAKIQEEVQPKIKDRLHVFFSKAHYLEFTNIEANKGLAVEFLANHLGITKEEVICVGDSFNDAYMIQYAGLGVAMENAYSEIKEMADYVTKSNMEDGVAHVIEKFIL